MRAGSALARSTSQFVGHFCCNEPPERSKSNACGPDHWL